MDESQEIWSRALEALRIKVEPEAYERWIARIVPLRREGRSLVLGLPGEFWITWVSDSYGTVIEETIKETTGLSLKVCFETCKEVAVPAVAEKPVVAPVAAAPAQEVVVEQSRMGEHPQVLPDSSFDLNPRFTFSTFVVGDNNKFAYSACMGVAQKPGDQVNPLFIHSGTGLGKTHLMQAIAQEAMHRNPKAKVLYVSSEDFLNQYIEALKDNTTGEFRRRYRNLDMLLIDDVQFIGNKQSFQEEIFHTFNALYSARKQIVMTSDRPPHEIGGLEKRLVSRFESGLTSEILPPDLETRIAILHKKQESQEYKLTEDVIRYVAERLKSNVRRLEGGLFKLVSWGTLWGKEVSIAETEKLLRDVFVEEKDSLLTIEDIQRIVAEFYDIRLADMTSKRRPANIALPRQVAMYFARKLLEESFPAIAEKFCRNHATVIHALNAIETKMHEDEVFKQELGKLEDKLKV